MSRPLAREVLPTRSSCQRPCPSTRNVTRTSSPARARPTLPQAAQLGRVDVPRGTLGQRPHAPDAVRTPQPHRALPLEREAGPQHPLA